MSEDTQIMDPIFLERGKTGLASYIHFKARECLDQAVLVAQKMPFNKKKVKEWCASEGAPGAYEDLIKKLSKGLK